MDDYLARAGSPLNAETWNLMDTTVVGVARKVLIGRRFIPIYGPLGVGIQDIDYDLFTGTDLGTVAMLGNERSNPVRAETRIHEKIPLIYKDFMLYWRDLATAQQLGMPVDISAAAAAATFCAFAEDNLIFNGNEEFGLPGLLTVDGRNSIDPGDWSTVGTAFGDIVAATELLLANGYYGPYAAVVTPRMFSQMQRVYANSGVLEITHVRDIATSGVFQSASLPEGRGLVVSTGPQNMDLAVAQDMTTAYLTQESMNHLFRVFESLALRIKRPGAICTLESGRPPRRPAS